MSFICFKVLQKAFVIICKHELRIEAGSGAIKPNGKMKYFDNSDSLEGSIGKAHDGAVEAAGHHLKLRYAFGGDCRFFFHQITPIFLSVSRAASRSFCVRPFTVRAFGGISAGWNGTPECSMCSAPIWCNPALSPPSLRAKRAT